MDFDAAIIGAFGDPGLTEARARLAIPVVGLGEAGLRAAANGRRFSIVTLGERCGRRLSSAFSRWAWTTGWRKSAFCNADPRMIADREAHYDAIAEAVRACAGDAILLGGAPLAGLGAKMTEKTGVTVLDGVEASVTEALKIAPQGVLIIDVRVDSIVVPGLKLRVWRTQP